MSEKRVRVRFAPSPTGPLHMGGVRTALYNFLFARQKGGDFILRIEDTDQSRFVPGAEKYIVESLLWCGLEPDESPQKGGDYGPYRQSERMATYRKYADQLVDSGNAYFAFDTPEELDALRKEAEANGQPGWKYDSATRVGLNNSLTLTANEVESKIANGDPYVIRIKIPEDESVSFSDEIRGSVTVSTEVLDDKVIFKSDGLPTYHLANVVDDHLMEISHVIRGEEWLPSAPLHVLLYRFLGWESIMPAFAHLPLILKPTGKGKLSKRDGDKGGFPVFPLEYTDPSGETTSNGYRESGYFSEAFVNILAMLGWNPGTEQELFSLEELIQVFSLDRVVKSGARFDPEKAKWFNQQWLWKLDDEELSKQLLINLESEGVSLHSKDAKQILSMMKPRIHFIQEVYAKAPYLFFDPENFDEKTVRKKWKEGTAELMLALRNDVFAVNESFDATSLHDSFKSYLETQEIGLGKAMPNLRLLLSGEGGGPDLFELMAYLGKETTLKRIDNGIERLAALKAELS